jgi:hypothetical protein
VKLRVDTDGSMRCTGAGVKPGRTGALILGAEDAWLRPMVVMLFPE